MDDYSTYIAQSRYARWLPEEGRRETWDETCHRYIDFWMNKGKNVLSTKEGIELETAIRDLEVMPSMRCLMTAGAALERDNVAGFNCAYMPVDSPRAFDECMFILMCGTGVGYSVERQYVSKLPEVSETMEPTDSVIVVADSKIGWATSFKQLLAMLYAGEIPSWDVSKVRGEGEPLKTFGGRASGPQPLVDLFKYTVQLFQKVSARGASGGERKLTDLEASDLMCKTAAAIVVGGVRRSALICLSNPSSPRMRDAKSGDFGTLHPERYLANISSCYQDRPEFKMFMDEGVALHASLSGERGFFSRSACKKIAAKNGRREIDFDFGTNPCSEIILRPNQFCNLTEVVVRAEDSLETLKEKVRKAAILGTLQASLTDFRYLRSIWKKNTEDEALLGLSLTGIMDHEVLSGNALNYDCAEWLNEMKEVAIETNKVWAERLGINPATAITCVKPSGTVSQLVNSASGIHPRFDHSYIRTVRADSKDPLTQYMQEAGFVHEEAEGSGGSTQVFSFAVDAPKGSVTVSEVGAMEQLRLWKVYQDHWCEHKASITVYYTDDEYLDVMSWMWKNFDSLSGISLLPKDDHVYNQAPYQTATAEELKALRDATPVFDVEEAAKYERGLDSTTGVQELACVAGNCEI